MSLFYILKGKLPIPVDALEWGRWFGTADRRVAQTTIAEGFWVSTVFLGLDHSFNDETPLLFETMVFSEDTDDVAWGYGRRGMGIRTTWHGDTTRKVSRFLTVTQRGVTPSLVTTLSSKASSDGLLA